jgi:hypothetical protein
MRVPKKPGHRTDRPKLYKLSHGPAVTTNKRLADQTRKVLGKHYANKYRGR